MGIAASAQIVDTGKNYELHIGDYVLVGSEINKKIGNDYGALEFRSENAEEVNALGKFIDENKVQLEKKYNIIIVNNVYGKIKHNDYRVTILAYSPEVYRKLQEIDSRKEQEREDRINSLKSVL